MDQQPITQDDLSHLAGCIIRNLSEVNPANGAIARDHIDMMIREELGSGTFRAGLSDQDTQLLKMNARTVGVKRIVRP